MQKTSKFLTLMAPLLIVAACADRDDSAGAETGMQAGDISYAPIPESILTPASVDTRIGTLAFFDGYASAATVDAAYDNLDFQRGVRAFLDAIPIASLYAMREGMKGAGLVDGTIGIFENLMDSKALFLTANTESIYALTWLDLREGPVVVESPPNTLGFVDDAFFNYVTDLGNAGPDRGQGGKYLFLPPGYEGGIPDGYFTYESGTYGNWLIWRGFLVDGDSGPGVESMKANTRVYRLADAGDPPEQAFVNLSGQTFNTIHANDFSYFEEINAIIQEEPVNNVDPELLGLLAAIGIEKGKPFAPDERMKALLNDAAAVGNATARALVFATRDLLDARTLFFYYATGITPAMAAKMVGVGSQYAGAALDSEGRHFDGGRTYKLTLPPDVPAKDFWSLVLYDNQTRSMLQTDQQFPSLNSQRGVQQNPDGSTDIFFGPSAPAGKASNWIQTVPGKGWSVILRLYGPLEPWFDKNWQPGEIELMEDIPAVEAGGQKMAMTTDIPASITTPDRVETRLGTLEFFDGFPTRETVELVYDNLDFLRGVETFLTAMPAASIHAIREGFRDVGVSRNGIIISTEDLMDAHSLFLTPNTESVYIMTVLDLSDGPVVVESPPNTLGMVNDFFFRYVSDMGNAGPDRGQGGKYLYLPPDWEGEEPEGFFTYRSPTYMNIMFWRGFLVEGDPGPAIESAKETLKVYPLGRKADAAPMAFYNVSGKSYNTIHSNDTEFYSELKAVIDTEPASRKVRLCHQIPVCKTFSKRPWRSAMQRHGRFPSGAATLALTTTRDPGGSLRSLAAVTSSGPRAVRGTWTREQCFTIRTRP
jgi:hypothetical protein